MSALACHPEYKLLSVSTIPQMPTSSIAYSTFSWPGLLKHLRQMLISNTKMEEGKCTVHHDRLCVFVCQHSGRFCPGTGIDWQVRPCAASQRSGSLTGSTFNTSLANLLVLRGKDVYSAETGQADGFRRFCDLSVCPVDVKARAPMFRRVLSTGGFEDPALYTSWLSAENTFHLWKSPVPLNKYEKSATLVSNSQALLRPLDNMVAKAWNMFASR